MFELLSEFTRRLRESVTVVIIRPDETAEPGSYLVEPRRVLLWLGALVTVLSLVLLSLILFTPVSSMLPGHVSAQVRQAARVNELRMEAMEDSLRIQSEYVGQLRDLLLGRIDTTVTSLTRSNQPASGGTALVDVASIQGTDSFEDQLQPISAPGRLRIAGSAPISESGAGTAFMASMHFPVLPPVSGIVTRSFEARAGHFAIDIAVDEGSLVRSIGEGYVILSDWTHDGGQILAIQHGDGYVSVYKHNSRLLKRVGDRVSRREVVAVSGNSGEISTGPHLHFELWHDGLAQDPNYYVTGL